MKDIIIMIGNIGESIATMNGGTANGRNTMSMRNTKPMIMDIMANGTVIKGHHM